MFVYKTQKGDTLLSLATRFGISSSTILWANAKVRNIIIIVFIMKIKLFIQYHKYLSYHEFYVQ